MIPEEAGDKLAQVTKDQSLAWQLIEAETDEGVACSTGGGTLNESAARGSKP